MSKSFMGWYFQVNHFLNTTKCSPTFPVLVCNILEHFVKSVWRYKNYYFLQIQPNRRPDLSSMAEPGRQHSPLHLLSVNKILEQKHPSWISVHSHFATYQNYNKILESNWLSVAQISTLIRLHSVLLCRITGSHTIFARSCKQRAMTLRK